MVRRILFTVASMLSLLVIASTTVLAGGAATVVLDEVPQDVRAGEPLHLEFMVWQHGQRAVDEFSGVGPVRPVLYATNPQTGETLQVEGFKEAGAEVGRFALDVTFPSEGTWEWYIHPAPFERMNEFEPLTVRPADAAMAPVAIVEELWTPGTVRAAARLGGIGFLAAALLLAMARQRQTPAARPVTARR